MKINAKDILLGVAVADALGVPFEFSTREERRENPAKDMVGFKVHNQPAGTWSDDSSLTFCLAEAMTEGYELHRVARKFIDWRGRAYWTAHGKVFDIGMTTNRAISRLDAIIHNNNLRELKLLRQAAEDSDNGNGSLMRILPLLFEIAGKDLETQFELVWENSALTHRHIRAAMCCMTYLKFAEYLCAGTDKLEAYELAQKDILLLWQRIDFPEKEHLHFNRLIQTSITAVKEKAILSGGYVIDSLEASFWCFLTTDSYEEAVLKAINLGKDTDTTAAITGGIAGIYYGSESIPQFWIASLARLEDILELAEKLEAHYSNLA